jgi:hypothetical protein
MSGAYLNNLHHEVDSTSIHQLLALDTNEVQCQTQYIGDLFLIRDREFHFEIRPLPLRLFAREAVVFDISITSKAFQYLLVNLRIHRR